MVIAAIARALNVHNLPSMDARLKNIVASQIGDLLRGGFALEDVRHTAVELALAYDEKRGHNRLCHLGARVRQSYWSAEAKRDAAAIKAEVSDLPLPSKAMGDTRYLHPSNHPFVFDSSTSCRVCGGPPGVHVRRTPPEAA